jgi:ABC-type molybdenum transport system ATPase subunit/photorepair protein PhrA
VIFGTQLEKAARRGTQLVIATHHAEDVPSFVTRRLDLGGAARKLRRTVQRGPGSSAFR